MKILLRKYVNKYYVWRDAVWNNGRYLFSDTGVEVAQTEILAVAEDNRIGYVRCANCGKIIKNDPESIEAHYKEEEAKKNCLTCPKVTVYGDKRNVEKTYEPNDDGTFNIIEKCVALLGCQASYYKREIHSSDAAANCIYSRCRRSGVADIDDVFVKYPGLFDKQITIDTLIANKYERCDYSNGYHIYDMKMRSTLFAYVNEMGIVDHFEVVFKGWNYQFYYSARYNKLFFYDWSKYDERVSNHISDAKKDAILTKLDKLYKEANENG